jgi:hypothetical protein
MGFCSLQYQTKDYFKIVRKLSDEGFNPKENFPPNIVSDADIAKIFGPSFEGFKTTNLNLHPKNKERFILALLESVWYKTSHEQ